MAEHLPLNALHAFEVAARTGSFVAAGEKLGVSSSAISQQVKALESALNRTLFLRQGNRITLTDAGRALYPRLETVFSDLVAVTRDLREGAQPSRLVVSALPSLAELWLMPALSRYPGRHTIDVRIEEDPVDFARSGAALRVTYGAHYYPDHHVQVLFRDRLIAVAAPAFLKSHTAGLTECQPTDLIHTDWGRNYIRQPDWSEWFAASGQPRVARPVDGLRTTSTLTALLAAQEGAGFALVPEILARAAIEKGSLVQVGETGVPMFSDYVLVYPHSSSRKRALKDLCDYLSPT